MIDGLKPYPAMKDSGVPWLGTVPNHWRIARIKDLARSGPDTFVDGDWIESPYIRTEGIRLIQTGNIGVGSYREQGFRYIDEETFRAFGCTEIVRNDVLICRLGDPVGRACLAPRLGTKMITSVDVCILKTKGDVQPAFIVYAMSAPQYLDWIGSLVRGSTRDRVSRSMLGNFFVPLPPLEEQLAIVRFFQHVDQLIRRYVAAKRKLIKSLEEQRQASIYRIVARGLDPNVRLKPSGLDWLGDVPEHWGVRRNGRLFAQRNETSFPDLPILEVSLRTGIRVRDFGTSDRKQVLSDRAQYKRAKKGDIAYNMMRMWQGAVDVVPVDGLISPAYVVARPLAGTDSRYFGKLFRTFDYMHEVDKYSRGIVKDRNRLYWEDFKRMPSPYPPPIEQSQIADAIDGETQAANSAIDLIRREINLLREFRTRLIADVVTGKLDVRAAATALPETAEEPEDLDADIEATDKDELEDFGDGKVEEAA
jgi:type I restriction enzyme, S subunit